MILMELVTENYADCLESLKRNGIDESFVHISKDAESAARQINELDSLTEILMSI